MMRLVNIHHVLAFCLVILPVSAVSGEIEAEARTFFARYIALGEAYDVSLADLYADDAVIHGIRRYPDGRIQTVQLSGEEWKSLIVKVMPLARAQQDRSTYSNIEVSVTGSRAKISADRYTHRKCYTDTGYFMIIERQDNGNYLIVDEYTETQPQSNC